MSYQVAVMWNGQPKFFELEDLETVAILVMDDLGRLEIARKLRNGIWMERSMGEILELVIAGLKRAATQGYEGKAIEEQKGSRWCCRTAD